MNSNSNNLPVKQIVELVIAVLTAILPFLLKKNSDKETAND